MVFLLPHMVHQLPNKSRAVSLMRDFIELLILKTRMSVQCQKSNCKKNAQRKCDAWSGSGHTWQRRLWICLVDVKIDAISFKSFNFFYNYSNSLYNQVKLPYFDLFGDLLYLTDGYSRNIFFGWHVRTCAVNGCYWWFIVRYGLPQCA